MRELYHQYREEFGVWISKNFKCDEELIADVYQQAFTTMYYNIKEGRLTELRSSLKTYLFAIGKNLLRDHFKIHSRRQEILEVAVETNNIDNSIIERYENAGMKETVKQLLTEIGEPCRTVLDLFYLKGYALDAIAGEMNYKTDQIAAKRKFICPKTNESDFSASSRKRRNLISIIMSQELDDQLFDYLEGRMTDRQRQEFERLLSEEPGLAEEIQDLQSLDMGLQAVGMEQLTLDMKDWEQEIDHFPPSVFTWKRYLAVAAVLTLILIPAIYVLTGPGQTSEALFLSYYQPYDELIISRSNEVDSLNLLLADGMEAYNRKAYEQCSDLLIQYLQKQPDAHRVALYLAIAQLELDLKDQAEDNFTRAQKDPIFKQQAQWYQALSYLKFSETRKAKLLLESIINTENHYRKKEAAIILNELR